MKILLSLFLLTASAFSQTVVSTYTTGPFVVNVKSFGAKGDGTTDDTTAIRNAASAATASRPATAENGAAKLYFPKGEYCVTGAITVELDRLHIEGDGSSVSTVKLCNTTTLPASDTTGLYAIMRSTKTKAHNWSIRNLSLRGEGEATSSRNNGLVLYNVQQNGTIEDVHISNVGGYGLYYDAGSDATNPEATLFSVRNSWILQTGLSGVYTPQTASSVTFENVHSERSKNGSNFVAGGLFLNCHVEFGQYGIDVPSGSFAVVSGVTGYAYDAVSLGYPSPVAMVRGQYVSISQSTSSYWGSFAIIDGITYSEASNAVDRATLNSWANGIVRRLRLGGSTALSGAASTVPLEVTGYNPLFGKFYATGITNNTDPGIAEFLGSSVSTPTVYESFGGLFGKFDAGVKQYFGIYSDSVPFYIRARGAYFKFDTDGTGLISVAFASLGSSSNGTIVYCSNCTKATPCASGGSGAIAKRINGAWDCN